MLKQFCHKKIAIVVLVNVLMFMGALSQQLPQVSHFMYDNVRTNPGSVGSLGKISATLMSRQQMTGFPGNPNDNFFSVEAPFKLFNANHGVGVSIYSDILGFYEDIDLSLSYAYKFNIGDGTLGTGINAGFTNKKLDPSWEGPNTESMTDPYIPEGSQEEFAFGLGLGLYYKTEELYFGASALNINSPEIEYSSGSNNKNNKAKDNLVPHYYVTVGYTMQLPNPYYELQPAVGMKSDGRITNIDLNTVLVYNKKIWGGVSYRTGAAVIGMIGLELIEGLKIGYSYDFATTALIREAPSTHEVLINYSFNIGVDKAPQKYKSIRYL